jgi:hypothetical protein
MVTGGYTGPGNISADPLFVNPTAGNDTTYNALLANWTLSACSPCIDSGADSLCNKPLDLEGNPRKFHRIDMGAYELKYDNSVVATNHSNTGRTITTLRWKSSIKPCHTLVFLKDTLTGSPAPAGGTIYTPNTVYGSGTNLDGWFCIYNGQDTTVSVTNLNEGTTYRLAVFNYILDSLYDAPGLMNFNTERTTLGDITKTYGDADFILQAQSFSGISAHTYTIDFDTIATITNDTASLAGAGTATITVRHNGNTEYLSDSTTAGLTVNKALLLVEAADTSRMAGLENPVFRLTYNGFAYDEDTTALIAVPTAFSPANLNSPPGQYPIIPSGGMAENYEISYLDGILTVEINTAIQSVQSQTGLRIYPVPTSDIVHIEALNDHKISQVNLYNLTGNQVLKINTADRQNPDISLKNLPAGDYMMEVNIEGECVRVKVMKR